MRTSSASTTTELAASSRRSVHSPAALLLPTTAAAAAALHLTRVQEGALVAVFAHSHLKVAARLGPVVVWPAAVVAHAPARRDAADRTAAAAHASCHSAAQAAAAAA